MIQPINPEALDVLRQTMHAESGSELIVSTGRRPEIAWGLSRPNSSAEFTALHAFSGLPADVVVGPNNPDVSTPMGIGFRIQQAKEIDRPDRKLDIFMREVDRDTKLPEPEALLVFSAMLVAKEEINRRHPGFALAAQYLAASTGGGRARRLAFKLGIQATGTKELYENLSLPR